MTEGRTQWLEEWIADNGVKTLEECQAWKESFSVLRIPITGLSCGDLPCGGPSIILCVKKWSPRAPQRGGSPHSGEGKNGGSHLITAERRGYKKIPLVGYQDIYKTDLQNSFRVDRAKLRAVSRVVTQIPSGT